VVVKASKGFAEGPFEVTARELQQLGVGTVSKDGWYHTLRFNDLSDAQLHEVVAIAVLHVERVLPTLAFVPVEPPVEAIFTRTDHAIIWQKHVPALTSVLGHHLRGELERTETDSIDKGAPHTVGGR
jgi:hypothetical protein